LGEKVEGEERGERRKGKRSKVRVRSNSSRAKSECSYNQGGEEEE
jgi:hypothetical protein